MVIDFADIWGDLKENWYKYGVILLMALYGWKYFVEDIRPVVKKEDDLVIKIPKQGVTITIKPLE